jgi:hypothetical protein
LDVPKTVQVKAVLDWIMFRRARTPICGPLCLPQAAAGVEAFQVWHLEVGGNEQLASLKAALEKANSAALAKFKFQRVGLLRYRDESAFSEETAARVLAMWKLVKPGPQVALGCVWESDPTTGQGWQNHFRLSNMLDQIASLTKPPATGSGALAAIAAPPTPLADNAFDGGMLVVTRTAVVGKHRLVLIPLEQYQQLNKSFAASTDNGWQDFLALSAKSPPVKDFDITFQNGMLSAASATAVDGCFTELPISAQVLRTLWAMSVFASPVAQAVEEEEHAAIINALSTLPIRRRGAVNDDKTFQTTLSELGTGVTAVTIIAYLDVMAHA